MKQQFLIQIFQFLLPDLILLKMMIQKFGNIQMFNSIGAGFGISYGKMTDYRNEIGELENSEFNNSISFHLGFLFSAGTENDNVFAPTFNIGLMDFQLGYGC